MLACEPAKKDRTEQQAGDAKMGRGIEPIELEIDEHREQPGGPEDAQPSPTERHDDATEKSGRHEPGDTDPELRGGIAVFIVLGKVDEGRYQDQRRREKIVDSAASRPCKSHRRLTSAVPRGARSAARGRNRRQPFRANRLRSHRDTRQHCAQDVIAERKLARLHASGNGLQPGPRPIDQAGLTLLGRSHASRARMTCSRIST